VGGGVLGERFAPLQGGSAALPCSLNGHDQRRTLFTMMA
jgi:hypothetical protein